MEFYKNKNLKSLEGEIWVDAFGFDGYYEVSNLGRIKSLPRYCSTGARGGQRLTKEIIRSQPKSKDGRLTCPFSIDGKGYSINVSALVYQSFNPTVSINVKKDCVCHLDKVQHNNTLLNLSVRSITSSHTLNFKKGLLPHLITNAKKRTEEYLSLTHKTCKKCSEEKGIVRFEYGRNTCIGCRKIEKDKRYQDKIKKNKIRCRQKSTTSLLKE